MPAGVAMGMVGYAASQASLAKFHELNPWVKQNNAQMANAQNQALGQSPSQWSAAMAQQAAIIQKQLAMQMMQQNPYAGLLGLQNQFMPDVQHYLDSVPNGEFDLSKL